MTDQTARKAEDTKPEANNATVPPEAQQAYMSNPANPKPYTMPDDGQDTQTDPLAEAKREAFEYKDKLLRTLAEMENLRKRTEREVSDARQYGIAGFARDVLAVADNMHRALATIDEAQRAATDPTVQAMIEGIELTERELMKSLEKNGVKQFTPQGEKFDPNLHQAMYEVPDASVAAGTVVQVMQPGYMIGDRMLRPAMVAVAKGGEKGGAKQPAADADIKQDN
jgi:molecular chaperone GrpE